ncbi:MAG: PIN domain-containing protein [Anaerolineae bacterium]|jgi:predicted nucleic acid-binding protein
MAATLIDTNVLVYAYDRAEPEKQRRALEVLDALAHTGDGRLSAQVISEFFVNVTRNIAAPLTVAQANERLQHCVQIWPVVPVTPEVVFEAIRGVQRYRFSFRHAQIWASARLSQMSLVLSEDLNPGAVIEGIRFVDPFADDFRLQGWGVGA